MEYHYLGIRMNKYFHILLVLAIVLIGCGDSRVIEPPTEIRFTAILDAVVPPTIGFEPTPGSLHAHLSDDAASEGGAIFISGHTSALDLKVPGSFTAAIAEGNSQFSGGSRLNVDAQLFPQTGLLSGYNSGDTVFFRAYPINGSVIEYTYDDHGNLVFANYGKGSNVLSFVLE